MGGSEFLKKASAESALNMPRAAKLPHRFA
jgi:hypothetical protein